MDVQQYLNKVKKFYAQHLRLPSYQEMVDLFYIKSKASVAIVVHQWIQAGILEKDGTNIVPGDEFFRIPLLGAVRAGFPDDGDMYEDEGIIVKYLHLHKPESVYALRVHGDSMIDEGIREGDTVILDKSIQPRIGNIVAANIDGEWTLKYFRKKRNKVYLEAANAKYKPLYPKQHLELGGVVTRVIRDYDL